MITIIGANDYYSVNYFVYNNEVFEVKNSSCTADCYELICAHLGIEDDGLFRMSVKKISKEIKSHQKYFTEKFGYV